MKTQLYLGYGVTFAVLSLLIISFLFLGVKQLMMDQIGQSRLDVLKQISERSNTIKNSTITISNLYRYDEEVQRCLSENGLSEEEMEQAGRYLDGVKENYDRVFHDVGVAYDVVILGDNGFRYASRGRDHYDFDGLESQLWYKRSYDAENDIVFISSFREKFDLSSREERYVFAAFRRVAGTDGRETGTILVNVDEKYLEDLYGTAEDRSNLYIFDKKGNIVSSREKSLLGKNFIGVDNFRRLYGENEYHIIKKLGQDYLLSNYYDPQTGWTIVEEMPCAVILQPLNQALVLLLAIVSGCLLAGTGAACYMSERISKPILKLCRLMDRVKQGDSSMWMKNIWKTYTERPKTGATSIFSIRRATLSPAGRNPCLERTLSELIISDGFTGRMSTTLSKSWDRTICCPTTMIPRLAGRLWKRCRAPLYCSL